MPERIKNVVDVMKEVFEKFGDDNVPRHAAALAYYAFISFFPLILVLVSLLGYALSIGLPAAIGARDAVINQVSAALPTAGTLLSKSFESTADSSGITGLIGLLTGLWAASNIFAQVDNSFNDIFDVNKADAALRRKLLDRLQAVLIVLLLAVLMTASVLANTILGTAQSYLAQLPGGGMMANALNIVLGLLLSVIVFGALYRYMPNKDISWRSALIGGLFAAVTWSIGREVLGWYLGSRDVPSAGEVVGAVLAFVALIYYFALILLLGAEIVSVYHRRRQLANVPRLPESAPPVRAEPVPRHPPSTFFTGMITGIGLFLFGLPLMLWRALRRRG